MAAPPVVPAIRVAAVVFHIALVSLAVAVMVTGCAGTFLAVTVVAMSTVAILAHAATLLWPAPTPDPPPPVGGDEGRPILRRWPSGDTDRAGGR